MPDLRNGEGRVCSGELRGSARQVQEVSAAGRLSGNDEDRQPPVFYFRKQRVKAMLAWP